MDGESLEASGCRLALTMIVAQALAFTLRENDDPRGAARDILLALEEEIASATLEASRRLNLEEGEMDLMSSAARSTVLSVARLADSYLFAMGAPPAGTSES